MAINGKLLDGLVTFVQVVSAGSFTLAADLSGHSTSYISKEINKLEARLGVRLLHRTTRSLSLTPEGELYFQRCCQIIEDAEQAENAIIGKQGEPHGLLRISCPMAYGLSNLSPKLSLFTEKYPKIQLELDLNDRKVDLVSDGFDIVIRAAAHLEDSSLISRRISQSEMLILASPDYITKHGMPAHPFDLTRHKIISYSNLKQPNIWGFQDNDGKQIQVHLESHVLTNNSRLEIDLGVAGQGIFAVPRFALKDELVTGKLIDVFPDWPKQSIGIYMVYPSRKHMSAKVRSFIDFVLQELGD
ncbi:LysR family transcriptional regulator [Psychromonas marina]|uniref:LysR family transcriptional regulator n=1 Tax=Psychromonas marina TaxID=88364 RepID=A0ABQ6DXN9_9GAMM|nr:LysR family transcriptional regulator [Psychromonas marina]GLS89753.1 LysR family transcriptional regulator [Psychromonas marina]